MEEDVKCGRPGCTKAAESARCPCYQIRYCDNICARMDWPRHRTDDESCRVKRLLETRSGYPLTKVQISEKVYQYVIQALSRFSAGDNRGRITFADIPIDPFGIDHILSFNIHNIDDMLPRGYNVLDIVQIAWSKSLPPYSFPLYCRPSGVNASSILASLVAVSELYQRMPIVLRIATDAVQDFDQQRLSEYKFRSIGDYSVYIPHRAT